MNIHVADTKSEVKFPHVIIKEITADPFLGLSRAFDLKPNISYTKMSDPQDYTDFSRTFGILIARVLTLRNNQWTGELDIKIVRAEDGSIHCDITGSIDLYKDTTDVIESALTYIKNWVPSFARHFGRDIDTYIQLFVASQAT